MADGRPGLFQGARQNWRYVLKFSALVLIFWLIQFLYQYFAFSAGDTNLSLLRASSLSGLTLVGIALIIGPVHKLWPTRNWIIHRRQFGVWGFTLALLHITMASSVFGLANLYASLDPLQNPVIWGAIAATLIFPMYITSTDWAVSRLGFKRWKAIHRLVYFGFLATILHSSQMNVQAMLSPPGYFLIFVTSLALSTELAAFVKHTKLQLRLGTIIGVFIIALYAAAFWYLSGTPASPVVQLILASVAVELIAIYLLYKMGRPPAPAPPVAPQPPTEPSSVPAQG